VSPFGLSIPPQETSRAANRATSGASAPRRIVVSIAVIMMSSFAAQNQ
jgi:hypothetical protein